MAVSAWHLPRKRARTVSTRTYDPCPHLGVERLLDGFVAFALLGRTEVGSTRPCLESSQLRQCSSLSPGVRGAYALITAAAPHDTARLLKALARPHTPHPSLNTQRGAAARKKCFAAEDGERLLYWTSMSDSTRASSTRKTFAAQSSPYLLANHHLAEGYSSDEDSEGELSAWVADSGATFGDPHLYSHLYALPPRSRRAALIALLAAIAVRGAIGDGDGQGLVNLDTTTATATILGPRTDTAEASAPSEFDVPIIKLPLRELTELLSTAVRDELACRRQHNRLWEVQQLQQQKHYLHPNMFRDALYPSPALHDAALGTSFGSNAASDSCLPFPEYPDCSYFNGSDDEGSKGTYGTRNDHTRITKVTANGLGGLVDRFCAPLLLALIDYALQGWQEEFNRLTDCVLESERVHFEAADPGAVELETAALASMRAVLVTSLVEAADANSRYKAWLLSEQPGGSSMPGDFTEIRAPAPPPLGHDSFGAEAVADQVLKLTNLRLPKVPTQNKSNTRIVASSEGLADPRNNRPKASEATTSIGSSNEAGNAAPAPAIVNAAQTEIVATGKDHMPSASKGAITTNSSSSSVNLPGEAAATAAAAAASTSPSPSDVLPTELREEISALAPKLARLDALGATALASSQAQALIKATCEVLNAAAAVGSTPTGSISGVRFSGGLEVLGRVCSNPASTNNGNMSDNKTHGAGNEVPSLALSQRSDALIGALCTAFVGPSLGSAACSTFLRAVLLPMGLALKKPASRLLVAAVCHAAQERPDLTVTHVLLPMLCRPAHLVNSAHCELSTRLIKSGHLPPNTLNILLQRLSHNPTTINLRSDNSSGGSDNSSSGASGDGEQCMWSDLTMPVLVTALNALADWGNSINRGAGGSSSGSGKSNKTQSGSGDQKSLLSASTASVLVEKLEHVVESSAPIRASLKAASLAHAIATKHTSRLVAPPAISVSRDHHDYRQEEEAHGDSSLSSSAAAAAAAEACEGGLRRALGQMSSFMAKSAIAALDRAAAAAAVAR